MIMYTHKVCHAKLVQKLSLVINTQTELEQNCVRSCGLVR